MAYGKHDKAVGLFDGYESNDLIDNITNWRLKE